MGISAALLLSSMTSQASGAETPVALMLRSCVNTPSQPCVERIVATDAKGHSAVAELTGVTQPTTELDGTLRLWTIDEYRLRGFDFEGSSEDRIAPRIVFRPLGSESCNADKSRCNSVLEEVQIVVEPSWLHSDAAEMSAYEIHLPHRSNDLVCGTKEAPERCFRPLNFNQDVTFDISLRLPESFSTAVVNAQTSEFALRQGERPQVVDGVPYATTTVHFVTVKHAQGLFAPLLPDPLGTSDYADFMIDQTNVWLFGTRSPQGKDLGKCAGIPSITVTANSVYQSVPIWNNSTQAVEVRLASFHLLPDGSPNVGSFQATISQAMGKCLWSVDLSTKTRVELSVTDGVGGDAQVATESSRFDGENFILTAQNFHYSSPTISFKLADPPKAAPTATKKRTITCVKGKQSKRVAALNPKCPKGWKQR